MNKNDYIEKLMMLFVDLKIFHVLVDAIVLLVFLNGFVVVAFHDLSTQNKNKNNNDKKQKSKKIKNKNTRIGSALALYSSKFRWTSFFSFSKCSISAVNLLFSSRNIFNETEYIASLDLHILSNSSNFLFFFSFVVILSNQKKT